MTAVAVDALVAVAVAEAVTGKMNIIRSISKEEMNR
jgi:hypothetical protein